MAEILVKILDAVHGDPAKDLRGCYKRGDPVVVMPDGHPWGKSEFQPPDQGGKFVVVKIPGLDPALVKRRLELSERSELILDPDTAEGVPTRRRAFRLDLTAFSLNTLRAMNRDGTVTLTLVAARDRFVSKLTLERAW